MGFLEDLKAEIEGDRPYVDVPVALKGTAYTFRIFRMDPDEWVSACDACPMRPGVLLDMNFGYNLRALTPLVVAETGRRLDGDDLVEMSKQEWTDLFKAIPGVTFGKFGDAIFQLNEMDPRMEIDRLRSSLGKAPAREQR